jgi:hypothetical protein
MRKVRFNKWIPAVYERELNSNNYIYPFKSIEGTNCWEKDFPSKGIFLQWVNTHIEYESSAGNYIVALVEMPDGTIAEVLSSNIQFVEPTVLP